MTNPSPHYIVSEDGTVDRIVTPYGRNTRPKMGVSMMPHGMAALIAQDEAQTRLRAVTNITAAHARQIICALGTDATNAIINQIAATGITLEELKAALGTPK